MHNDKTAQDARRLLVAISINHPEARMVSPSMMDRPFSPGWADAEQAGLDRVRRDAAMGWLIDNNLLEREEEAENQQGQAAQADTEVTERCKKSAKSAPTRWPKN